MPKQEKEYFDVDIYIPWTQVDGLPKGVMEKILSIDEYGNKTRLLKFPAIKAEPGKKAGSHDFWEETYIMEGSLHDVEKDVTYSPGYYACRPPGMNHGPFSSTTGCLLIEFHYYKD